MKSPVKFFVIFCFPLSFTLLPACMTGVGGASSDSKECRYYTQAKQGESGLTVGEEAGRAVRDLQHQISNQCAPGGKISLNAAQCKNRLLEDFRRRHYCG